MFCFYYQTPSNCENYRCNRTGDGGGTLMWSLWIKQTITNMFEHLDVWLPLHIKGLTWDSEEEVIRTFPPTFWQRIRCYICTGYPQAASSQSADMPVLVPSRSGMRRGPRIWENGPLSTAGPWSNTHLAEVTVEARHTRRLGHFVGVGRTWKGKKYSEWSFMMDRKHSYFQFEGSLMRNLA